MADAKAKLSFIHDFKGPDGQKYVYPPFLSVSERADGRLFVTMRGHPDGLSPGQMVTQVMEPEALLMLCFETIKRYAGYTEKSVTKRVGALEYSERTVTVPPEQVSPNADSTAVSPSDDIYAEIARSVQQSIPANPHGERVVGKAPELAMGYGEKHD